MKKLLTLFVLAAAFATAQPYTSTVTTRTVTAADCIGQVHCRPGIVVTASTQDPQATAFGFRISYFAGGEISELKTASIDPTTKLASVEFSFPDPALIALQKVIAWPLVNPPSDPPAIVDNDPRER